MDEAPVRTGRLTPDELTSMVSQAKKLEDRYPQWIILAGSFSRQFIAHSRFCDGLLVANSLAELETGMRHVEDQHRHALNAARRDEHRPAA